MEPTHRSKDVAAQYKKRRRRGKPASGRLIQARMDEGAGFREGFAAFGPQRRENLPDMRQFGPGLEDHVDPGLTGLFHQPRRIIEQDLAIAGLDEKRRQALQISVKRRDQRM